MIDYKALFGPTSSCACEHCRSVFGPAAYLVDVLHDTLDDGLRENLFARRPDIEQLELSCANTETALPYVDLANEILENAIARPTFTLKADHTVDLDKATLTKLLRTEFDAAGFLLSAGATVVPHSGNRWTIRDQGMRYAISGTKAQSVLAMPQTFGSTEELEASPRHGNLPAYRKLADAVYGWDLPFDLGAAQARAYLDQLGVTRTALMAAFLAPGAAADVAIAAESIGLTTLQRLIITEKTQHVLADFWGGVDPAPLKAVPTILQKSGLSYEELIELLATRFVNPNLTLVIKLQDKTNIGNLDAAELSSALGSDTAGRIHRFARLRRTLGWTARELDKAVKGLSADKLDDDLIVALAEIQAIRAANDLAVDEVVAFWGPIGIDGDDSLYARLFLNPAVSKPVDAAFALVEGEPAAYVTNSGKYIADHAPALSAALGVSAPELDALLQAELARDAKSLNPAPTSDLLTVVGLSRLHRSASLARMLDVSISDFLTLRSLASVDPFDGKNPRNLQRFAALVKKIQASGVSLAQLAYVIRGEDPTGELDPSRQSLLQLAQAIRDGLRNIADATALAHDADGSVTRRSLSLLWKEEIADRMTTVLLGTASFASPLSKAPAPSSDDLGPRVAYDDENKVLRYAGVMTSVERTRLHDLPGGDDAYKRAILDLHAQPRDLFVNATAFLRIEDVNADLFDNPTPSVEQKLQYFLAALMPYLRRTLGERLVKKALARSLPLGLAMVDTLTSAPLAARLQDCLVQSVAEIPTTDSNGRWEGWLSVGFNEAYAFFGPEDGSFELWVDDKRTVASAKGAASDAVLLTTGQLYRVAYSVAAADPQHPPQLQLAWRSPSTAREPIPAASLIAKSTIDAFTTSYRVLHKAALAIRGLGLTAKEVAWLVANVKSFGPFDLASWDRLYDLVALRKSFKPRPMELVEALGATSLSDAEDRLARITGWDKDWLVAAMGSLIKGFNLQPNDLQLGNLHQELWPVRLSACLRILAHLGVTADKALDWARHDPDLAQDPGLARAQDIKSTAKAKYDEHEWRAVGKPIEDELRNRRATALVSYLLSAYPLAEPKSGFVAYLTDPSSKKVRAPTKNDLFDYFLIDVEMDACMTTSRLKQAIGAVQLFVQRTLMNLEPGLALGQDQARHWTQWMSRYRIWEANRKVFLYPENWIEPELRDDKTPFFKELESELLQTDLTSAAAEDALLHYLEKLHGVGRLQIAAMHHEERPHPDRPDEGRDVFHVVGRTWHVPHVYYYRRREQSYSRAHGRTGAVLWTPWEKIDADIQGDHLIAAVWNRRLHLFWPIFTEKQDAQTTEQRANDEDPPKYMAIQLAWSEYRNGKWTPKHLSSVEESLVFKARYSETAKKFDEVGEFFFDRPGYTFKVDVHEGSPLLIRCLHADYTMDLQEPKKKPPTRIRAGSVINLGDVYRSPDGQVTLSFKQTTPPAPGEGELLLEGHGLLLWKPDTHRKTITLVTLQNDGNFWLTLRGYKVGDLADQWGADHWETGTHIPRTDPNDPNSSPIIPSFLQIQDDGVLNLFGGDPDTTADPPDLKTRLWSSLGDGGSMVIPPPPPAATQKVRSKGAVIGEFHFTGCGSAVTTSAGGSRDYIALLPERTVLRYGAIREAEVVGDSLDLLKEDGSDVVVLRKTPGLFRVPFSPQTPEFESQDFFFFEDEEKTFLVDLEDQPADVVGQLRSASPGQSQSTQLGMPYANVAFERNPSLVVGLIAPLMTSDVMTVRSAQQPSVSMSGIGLGSATGNVANIDAAAQLGDLIDYRRYAFEVFYHPYACEAMQRLEQGGIDALMAWPLLPAPNHTPPRPVDFGREGGDFSFKNRYDPDPKAEVVKTPYPQELFDLATEGSTPYSQYNWELFFHAPLLIATQLSKRQRFVDAQKWFHYVFDPTNHASYAAPARFWRFRRFFDDALRPPPETLDELMRDASELAAQVGGWRDHPFDPHLIARTRLVAYQKNVVMKYIDNLIAWGDHLFRQETLEALNEATLLYVLAAEILGERPSTIAAPVAPSDDYSYQDLAQGQLDAFSERLVDVENLVADDLGGAGASGTGWRVVVSAATQAELFCLPANEQLLGYWDTVADRLYKLRHCMDIEGKVRQLPLFEPPIDPALLVRAAAAGVDLDSVLSDANAPLPHYRFTTMAQKASELVADVKALGTALLAAIEKQDSEAMAQLRAGDEIALLETMRTVKQQHTAEAKEALAALERSRTVLMARQTYYATRQYTNAFEMGHLSGLGTSRDLIASQATMEYIAAILNLIPNSKIGAVTTLGVTFGGANVAAGIQSAGAALGATASALGTAGSMSATLGGFDRRMDEWKFQADLATKELAQLDKQIAAAEIRAAITEQELANHETQIEQSKAVFELLRTKFTNRDLHLWMSGEISGLYFQAYQLAYDLARKAERAYQFERADFDTRFIQFGSWDGMVKGLLAGERLYQDLKRMEAAYLDQNRRDYEITKHVSLVDLDPAAFLALKETGSCFIKLPESLFDADFPGQFLRRVKAMSVTIPCVTGPFSGVNCRLTLLGNAVRMTSKPSTAGYTRKDQATRPDPRFRDNLGAVQSIVTSHGQNDGGLFELNFRDERYLPFEGAGAIGEWRIELDPDCNRFDFATITDVVLHLKYTARDGGAALAQDAKNAVQQLLDAKGNGTTPLVHVFSARHDFSDEWYRLGQNGTTLSVDLTDAFPHQPRGAEVTVVTVDVFVKPVAPITDEGRKNPGEVILGGLVGQNGAPTSVPLSVQTGPAPQSVHHYRGTIAQAPGRWSLQLPPNGPFQDVWIACSYKRVLS